jgi:hypothetical protein
MSDESQCSPGNPHADRPNWRPAETIEEYLQNCEDGLEKWTYRRAEKLFGLSRMQSWRMRAMAEIPEDLFEHIMRETRKANIRPSTKMLAQIGLALRRGVNDVAEVQCCPHCGGELRVRYLVSEKVRAIINAWFDAPKSEPVICLPYSPQ